MRGIRKAPKSPGGYGVELAGFSARPPKEYHLTILRLFRVGMGRTEAKTCEPPTFENSELEVLEILECSERNRLGSGPDRFPEQAWDKRCGRPPAYHRALVFQHLSRRRIRELPPPRQVSWRRGKKHLVGKKGSADILPQRAPGKNAGV